MSAVDVEIAEDISGTEAGPDAEPPPREPPPPRRERTSPDVEIEREVTKRQIIESVTSVLVVILYMVFTLVRDRDSGVVVIDPDERDDWSE